MSHPDVETIVFSFNGDTMPEGMDDLLNEWQDVTSRYIDQEAERLGISYGAMADIYYYRTRSRWTQEGEDYLISLAKTGKSLPNVGAGEF